MTFYKWPDYRNTCLDLPSFVWFYEQFYLTKITTQERLAFYNCYLCSLPTNLCSLDVSSIAFLLPYQENEFAFLVSKKKRKKNARPQKFSIHCV